MELTHASFFSGVGGLDLGLERAGWRTVSFSEIDPYASAVLAERWPGVPNLGNIVRVATGEPERTSDGGGSPPNGQPDTGGSDLRFDGQSRHTSMESDRTAENESRTNSDGWQSASLWSGGFPCQDLSVAGKRAGFAGARSSLAFAFLDLVERHRPPAILLENVPGLLSSNAGRDFGRLLREMGELGYWWAYRILDARHFGVPQRRRRVFIVGLHAGTGLGADSAAAVLSVGTRCPRHPATGHATGEGAAPNSPTGTPHTSLYNATAKFGEFVEDDTAGNLSARDYKSSNHLIGYGDPDAAEPLRAGGPGGRDTIIGELGTSPDPGGVRAADGLAGRLDDLDIVQSLDTKAGGPDDNEAQSGQLVTGEWRRGLGRRRSESHDMGLPLGLDSHRYRCCGNGVVSSVSEWIGLRLAEVLQ